MTSTLSHPHITLMLSSINFRGRKKRKKDGAPRHLQKSLVHFEQAMLHTQSISSYQVFYIGMHSTHTHTHTFHAGEEGEEKKRKEKKRKGKKYTLEYDPLWSKFG